MSAKPKRIFTRTGETGGVPRELHGITRNQYGDILFILDGGETWQFTPGFPRDDILPLADEVVELGGNSPAGANPSNIGFVILENPARSLCGNFRIFTPPASGQAEPKKPTGGKPKHGGKKHNLSGKEKWFLQSLIREIVGGKQPKGERPPEGKVAREKVMSRVETHSILKDKKIGAVRTLDGWIKRVSKGGTIPGAHP